MRPFSASVSIVFAMLLFCGVSYGQAQILNTDSTSIQDTLTVDNPIRNAAQTDTLLTEEKESRRERRAREKREQEEAQPVIFKDSARLAVEHKTRVAWRRSAILPGWGQVTNGGLWWIKVPVIYGGFVTTGLVFEFNNRYYKSILKDVQYRSANNHAIPPNSPYDYIAADPQGTQYLITAKDYYRRNRDLMILVSLGWYALNMVDAYVESMLKNRWDIGDGLSVKVNPSITPSPTPFSSPAPMFGFNVKFDLKY